MKKNIKIISISLIFLLGIFLTAGSAMGQGLGTTKAGDSCSMPTDCQAGLDCVPCASYGGKCVGDMCWPTGTGTGTGTGIGAGTGTGTGAAAGTGAAGSMDCSSGVCFPISTSLPDPSGGMIAIITNVLSWILGIFGMLAVMAFVISGAQYILSAGSEKMIDNAKSHMKWSIVGVAVALSGLIVIYAIDKMLRGISNF